MELANFHWLDATKRRLTISQVRVQGCAHLVVVAAFGWMMSSAKVMRCHLEDVLLGK